MLSLLPGVKGKWLLKNPFSDHFPPYFATFCLSVVSHSTTCLASQNTYLDTNNCLSWQQPMVVTIQKPFWPAESKVVCFQHGEGQVSTPLNMSVPQLLPSDATDTCREARAGQCWECRVCTSQRMANGITETVFDGGKANLFSELLLLASTSVYKSLKKWQRQRSSLKWSKIWILPSFEKGCEIFTLMSLVLSKAILHILPSIELSMTCKYQWSCKIGWQNPQFWTSSK